ncbi:MAG: ankyrin repeat domain-containing protein [Polyangiaceae bacterium]
MTQWDGITQNESLQPVWAQRRQRLADAAKAYDWRLVFELLTAAEVNSTRPSGRSWYAPLHQAAHGGAPLDVVRRLLALGAFRALRCAAGERPVDIARRRGHAHLSSALEPVYRHRVASEELEAIQRNFHAVIRGRVERLVDDQRLRLPELEPLLELEEPRMVFPVPGMYGAFHYELDPSGAEALLICESASRVAERWGERHEVTARGSQLVANEWAPLPFG